MTEHSASALEIENATAARMVARAVLRYDDEAARRWAIAWRTLEDCRQ